jgi:hypothetical protein
MSRHSTRSASFLRSSHSKCRYRQEDRRDSCNVDLGSESCGSARAGARDAFRWGAGVGRGWRARRSAIGRGLLTEARPGRVGFRTERVLRSLSPPGGVGLRLRPLIPWAYEGIPNLSTYRKSKGGTTTARPYEIREASRRSISSPPQLMTLGFHLRYSYRHRSASASQTQRP